MDQLILFQHAGFRGAHRHVFADESNLNNNDDRYLVVKDQGTGVGWSGLQEEVEFKNFNDTASSLIVTGGTWQLYKHSEFREPLGQPLTGPRWVRSVAEIGIENDSISSVRKIS